MEPMSEAQEIHAQILANRKEIDAIELELAHALAIQEMIPTAFDQGSVSIRWSGYRHGERVVLRGVLIDGNGDEHPLPDDAAQRLSVCAKDLTPKK
tara:strand:+ start:676 stop:963 length:288 start_codon:yes stop_codon:yes gene_type:complete